MAAAKANAFAAGRPLQTALEFAHLLLSLIPQPIMGERQLPISPPLHNSRLPTAIGFPQGMSSRPDPTPATVASITESIVRNTGTDPKYIYVIFEDVAPADWAGDGKLFGS